MRQVPAASGDGGGDGEPRRLATGLNNGPRPLVSASSRQNLTALGHQVLKSGAGFAAWRRRNRNFVIGDPPVDLGGPSSLI